MARTESNMLELGTIAPDFRLPDTISGREISLSEVRGPAGTLVMFICNHCPYVIHVNEELVRVSDEYQSKGIGVVAISSNSVITHPQDGPEEMKTHAAKVGYNFPYLYDESQDIAKAYDAACTPDFYLFDDQLKLVYRGQLDKSRPGTGIPITGNDLRSALDSMLNGLPVNGIQYPSMGCNIKWHPE
jgi:peroxiredoxin